MDILGFIPARSGSKGVRNKNIKKLKGIPLIEFSVYTAIESKRKGYLKDILVSTDSEEYLEILSNYEIIKDYLRPSNLANDSSPTIDSVIDALNWFKKNHHKKFDAVMILQPTSPFRTPEHIKEAIKLLKKHKQSSCIASIQKLGDHHPKRIKRLGKDDRLIDFCSNARENEPSRRQDFQPSAYIRNGAIYLSRTKTILEDKLIRGDHVIGMPMPASNSINIDEHFDFLMASAALEYDDYKDNLSFFNKLITK